MNDISVDLALAAARSIPHPAIPHPRQEPDMTAPHPSPAEQAVIDRFGIFEPEERGLPPVSADLAWLDAAEAREERAAAEVARICEGGRWIMRVPVDEDRDSDTVIMASLADLRRLIAELRKRDAALREFAELEASYPLGSDVPVYRIGRILAALSPESVQS